MFVVEDGDGVCGLIYGLLKWLWEFDGVVVSVYVIGSVVVVECVWGRGFVCWFVLVLLEIGWEVDWVLLFIGIFEVYCFSGFMLFVMFCMLVGLWLVVLVVEVVVGVIFCEFVGFGSFGVVYDVYEWFWLG